MQFTDEYIKKNYPSFFKKYEIEVNQTAMPKIFSEALERKKGIIEMFSLGDDGRFVVSEYPGGNEHAYEAFRSTCDLLTTVCGLSVVRDVLGFVPLSNVLDNALSTGQKFSRAILRFADDPAIRKVLDTYKKDLCLELPLLPLEGRSDLKLIVQNFYSELAKYKKTNLLRIVLSVNPCDMLTASTGKVSSCNKLGGEYEAAPLAAARSRCMGIIRVENSAGELQGRCWIAFSKNLESFLLQKIYGQMSHEHVHAVSNWLAAIISKKKNWKSDGWTTFSGDIGEIDSRLFTDQANCGEFYVDPNSKIVMHKDSTDIPIIVVGDAPCLKCGSSKLHEKLVCSACMRGAHTCSVCNSLVSFAAREKNTFVCAGCADSCGKCETCGKLVRAGKRFCLEHATLYTPCFICGGAMGIDRNYKEESAYVSVGDVLFAHTRCVNNKLRTCDKCGSVSRDSNWWHCPECAERNAVVELAQYTLRSIHSLRRKARTCKASLPTTSFTINLPDYALAA